MIRTCEAESELVCRQSQQLLRERWVAVEDCSEVGGGSLLADLRVVYRGVSNKDQMVKWKGKRG